MSTLQHPACKYTFDELVAGLEDRVVRGLIREVISPHNASLALYCYSQRTVVDREWDDFTIAARGLVLDHGRRTIAALPFPKFFNYGEREEDKITSPFVSTVSEKVDGSLAIAFFDEATGLWRCVTKGAFTSPQALRATRELNAWSGRTDALHKGVTYLFEIVYREDRKVVAYDYEGLVLLSAYRSDASHEGFGQELPIEVVRAAADALHVRTPGEYTTLRNLADIAAACDAFGRDQEGFVVRFRDGLRLKFKGREYLRLHRLISNVTPLFVWNAMRNRDPLDAIRNDLPEEFFQDFDGIVAALQRNFDEFVQTVETEAKRHEHKTDKELGLSLSEVRLPVQPYIFAVRKHGPRWFEQPKTWGSLWTMWRPTHNQLKGYTPSTRLQSAVESE